MHFFNRCIQIVVELHELAALFKADVLDACAAGGYGPGNDRPSLNQQQCSEGPVQELPSTAQSTHETSDPCVSLSPSPGSPSVRRGRSPASSPSRRIWSCRSGRESGSYFNISILMTKLPPAGVAIRVRYIPVATARPASLRPSHTSQCRPRSSTPLCNVRISSPRTL